LWQNKGQEWERGLVVLETTVLRDATAEKLLMRLTDTENHPEEVITPYQEFSVENKIYYFTPGGFLYRRTQEQKL
jgi:hypothetical protein